MKIKDASQLITQLKGSALSCLVLMFVLRKNRRNWSTKQLSVLTGWSKDSVSNGLKKLVLNNFVLRLDFETWQLTDMGYQLTFDAATLGDSATNGNGNANYMKAENFDFGSSGYINHDMGHENMNNIQLLLPKAENFDFEIVRNSIFERLERHLILCGTSPDLAQKAIITALPLAKNWREIEIRILFWRGYCATQKDLKHAGNLIAKRISQGIDPPIDFSLNDFPDKLFDLRQEISDLQEELNHDMEQATTE